MRKFRERLFLGAVIGSAIASFAPVASADTPAHVDTTRPNPPIPYPVGALHDRATGTVLMKVHVQYNGRAIGVGVLQSSGNKDLDNAAADGVMNWHYVPATEGGETVTDWAAVRVTFTLPPDAQPNASQPVSKPRTE